MFVNALNSAIVGGLYGLQRMRGPALTDLARAYVAGVAGVVILYTTGSLRLMVLSAGLASLIPLFINLRLLWPEIRGRCRIDVSAWKLLLRGGLPFFIWAAVSTFYGTIDIPMLHAYAGDEVVGWYTLAYKWVNMPIFFASVVGTACLPALSAEGTRLSQSFTHLANRATYLVALVTIPAAVGLILVAQQLLDVIYHGQFDGAVPLMQILALQIPIVSLDIILGTVVIAVDRQRGWVIVAVLAALFNPLFNAMAMPVTEHLFNNAAIGASVATVLTEVVLMVGALILRPAGVFNRSTVGLLGRITAAACCMVPTVLVLGQVALPVKVVVGMLTFAVAAVAFRAVSPKEMRSMVLEFVRRRDEQPSGAAA
jgi:O-antigen/teichoic acid export membrane protein